MALPISSARRALFDPMHVDFHDGAAVLSIVETDPGGAATVDFIVSDPSITLRGKAGTSLYWAKSQRCADGAIVIWCADGAHVHLIELKQTITAKTWTKVKTQLDGMLNNVQAMLGAALLPPPTTVTCHVAFANDRLAASPVLSKVVNTSSGPKVLPGAEWAAGFLDLVERVDVPVRKIPWGSAAVTLSCP